jgi:hypothetical protein
MLTADQLREKLGQHFDCEDAGSGPSAAGSVWKEIEELDDQGAMGPSTQADQKWTSITANELAIEDAANRPER